MTKHGHDWPIKMFAQVCTSNAATPFGILCSVSTENFKNLLFMLFELQSNLTLNIKYNIVHKNYTSSMGWEISVIYWLHVHCTSGFFDIWCRHLHDTDIYMIQLYILLFFKKGWQKSQFNKMIKTSERQ